MAQDGPAGTPSNDEIAVFAFVEYGLTDIATRLESDPAEAIRQVSEFIEDLRADAGLVLSPPVRAFALTRAAGVMIDAADIADDRDALRAGMAVAENVSENPSFPDDLRVTATHFRANALGGLFASEMGDARDSGPIEMSDALWKHRGLVHHARVLQLSVWASADASEVLRSRAACNLANLLDDMGRWVEAYEWYQRALELDPSNGNAAGNIAVALNRVLAMGWASPGHVAALYNHYLELAQQLQEDTARIAGAGTARRYADMQFIDGQIGHLLHSGDDQDDYQRWIVEHRLALAPAVEGLGKDGPHWDSVTLSAARAVPDQAGPPPVFAMLDALKAEFVAARRLAYSALCTLESATASQGPADSGVYAAVGDGIVQGEHIAQLVLAQRSALDALDKLAVVANEHLNLGEEPSRIDFRKFWQKDSGIRPGLCHGNSDGRAAFALADLADDLGTNGLYSHSQALRNAGTHRIVVASLTEGSLNAGRDSMSTIDLDTLIASTLEALKVARAAYLYLIGLFEDWLTCDPLDGPLMPLMDQ